MRRVEMTEATGSLSEYAKSAQKEAVVVTRHGKPFAAVVPLDAEEWEDFVVSKHPEFIRIIRRSEARYRAEGGISLEAMRRKYGLEPKAKRKPLRKAG